MPRPPRRLRFTPELLGWSPTSPGVSRPRASQPDRLPVEVSPEKYREVREKTLIAINAGLVGRLIRHPHTRRGGEWLKKRFLDGAWFESWVEGLAQVEQTYGEKALDHCLAGLVNAIATERPPRQGTPACSWVTLNWHYDDACHTWRIRRDIIHSDWASRKKRAEACRLAAPGWAKDLYDRFNNVQRCKCGGKDTPPPNLNRWLEERPRTDRDLIEYVLRYYHGLKLSQLRRLLDYGIRQIKSWQRRVTCQAASETS